MPELGLDTREPASAPAAIGDIATADRRARTCIAIVQQFRTIEKAIGARLAATPELSMLLDLYLAGMAGRETCLWEVCNATTVPLATAHRKIGRLVDLGLVVRQGPSRDHRRIGLELSATGKAILDGLMDRMPQ